MSLELLAVVNASTLITDDHQVHLMAQAVSRQIHKHAAPGWDRQPCTVLAMKGSADANGNVTTTPNMPDNAIPIFILDDSDQANALGYHDETPDGRQYGRVFVKPVLDNGGSILEGGLSVSSVLSHEALEWFVDPACSYWAGPDGTGFLYALEVGDPVESDSYAMPVGSTNVSVSNFVLPAWFDPQAPNGSQFDLLGNVLTPFTMSKGGYVIKMQPGQESQAFAAGVKPTADDILLVFGEEYPQWRLGTKNHPGSRTNRRGQRFEQKAAVTAPDNALQDAPSQATPGQ